MNSRYKKHHFLKIADGNGLLLFFIILIALFAASSLCAEATVEIPEIVTGGEHPWWIWPLSLLAVTFLMGIVAVLAGVGGGVLFVPLVGSFFPFHLDFVRCSGLLIALTCALAATPGLLKMNLASLRLAIPAALIASASSIAGALIGLALPTTLVRISLGIVILVICFIMIAAKKSEYPTVTQGDSTASTLRIYGIYREMSTDEMIHWKVHRTPLGLSLFVIVGFAAGMFGLGAGWANVPVLNLVMGAPLKISIATSMLILSVTDTSAAWIYINNGCVLPLIAIPSIIGVMLGSLVGVRLFTRARPAVLRWIVIAILAFAGIRTLLQGLGFYNG
jgi:hypothetical protein